MISNEETEQRNKDAGAALLDRIGPAIVLTHSQSGTFGWLIADGRPTSSRPSSLSSLRDRRSRR